MARLPASFSYWLSLPEGWFAVVLCLLFGAGLAENAERVRTRLTPVPVLEVGIAALSLTVQAETAAGAAVVPVRVRLFQELDSGRWREVRTASGILNQETMLRSLPSGKSWVLVDAPGYARHAFQEVLYGTEVATVKLVPAEPLEVTVTDTEGVPIPGATVLVRKPGELPFGGLTDDKGRRLLTELPAGPHRVEVFARGYQSAERSGVVVSALVALERLGALHVQVRNPDQQPAANAEVWIVGSCLWPMRRIRTNPQGIATIAGIGEGVFDVRATAGNLVSETLSGLALARGEQRSVGLDLRPGRFVTVDVVGLRENLRERLEGARVVVAEQGVSSFPLTALSDAAGRAIVGPVARTALYVSARAPGFISRGVVPLSTPTDEVVQVELVEGGKLRGTIVDEQGYPIAGARIEVVGFDLDGQPVAETPLLAAYREAHFDASLQPLAVIPAGELGVTLGPVPFVNASPTLPAFDTLPPDYAPWMSDFSGIFRASPVPPGKVRVRVYHPRFTDALSDAVSLGPGGSAEVNVVMSNGATVEGRVVDDRGFPVAGARVVASAVQGSYERSTTSLEDGTFSLDAVPRRITLALARPGDPSRLVVRETLAASPGQTLTRDFILPKEREGVEWRVVDPAGDPVELAQVSLMSLDPSVPLRATRFSDRNGAVAFADVQGLRVRVSIQASGWVASSEQLEHAPAERVFTLLRGVAVTGLITAVGGRVEVAGAHVVAESGDRRDSAYTSARGEYQFRGIAPGKLRLRVEHPEYAAATAVFQVEVPTRDDRAAELPAIDLSDAVAVSGVVRDARGDVVSGARVALEFLGSYAPRGAEAETTVRTSADGTFTLSKVAPGKITVFAVATGKGRAQLAVDVESGRDTTDLELILDASGESDQATPSPAGVAVTLGVRDSDVRRVWVVHVAPNSEAERGGLRVGDEVVSVDGERVASLEDARERLSGPAGGDAVVQVRRHGTNSEFRVRREDLSWVR